MFHRRIQSQPAGASLLDKLSVSLKKEASYEGLQIDVGSKLTRHLVNVRLEEPHSFGRIDSLVLAADQQHFDSQTCIEHLSSKLKALSYLKV